MSLSPARLASTGFSSLAPLSRSLAEAHDFRVVGQGQDVWKSPRFKDGKSQMLFLAWRELKKRFLLFYCFNDSYMSHETFLRSHARLRNWFAKQHFSVLKSSTSWFLFPHLDSRMTLKVNSGMKMSSIFAHNWFKASSSNDTAQQSHKSQFDVSLRSK